MGLRALFMSNEYLAGEVEIENYRFHFRTKVKIKYSSSFPNFKKKELSKSNYLHHRMNHLTDKTMIPFLTPYILFSALQTNCNLDTA